MTAEELIKKAKVQLVVSQPFFATLALNMEYIEDASIPTMCTNGDWIRYNPTFTESLTMPEIKGTLCHEVMHPAMMHHLRRNFRHMEKWNWAADYAINPIIIEQGMQLPKGVLLDDKYKGMSAELIYTLLPDKVRLPQGIGDFVDSDAKDEAGKILAEQKVKQMLTQARTVAKMQGKLSGSLKKLIDELLEPYIDWREVLARFLSDPEKNDYSMRKPNLRYLPLGVYLPALYSETVGDVVFFIDTSGSVDDKLLTEIGSEIQETVNTFDKGFTVVYIDTIVQDVVYIEPDGDVKLEAKGRGGTDFRPGFEWLKAQGREPMAVVYLTDMACDSFPEEPSFPVLWMQYGNYVMEPPFGELIKIK